MNISQQKTGMLAMLTKGLLTQAWNRTELMLGDRNEYLGMSDLGTAIECPRSCVAKKVSAYGLTPDDWGNLNAASDPDAIVELLEKNLPLNWGHWVEEGLVTAFSAQTKNIIHQLEIKGLHGVVPFMAHLDVTMVFGGKTPSIRVLELKATPTHYFLYGPWVSILSQELRGEPMPPRVECNALLPWVALI